MDQCWPLIQEFVDLIQGKSFLTGEKLMWIDFAFFELVMFMDMLSGEVVCQHYEVLGAYVERFKALPEFKDIWADDVKCMKWPWNGDMAAIGGRDSEQ
jgi:hypothetical protein